jgi:hypothetical protein
VRLVRLAAVRAAIAAKEELLAFNDRYFDRLTARAIIVMSALRPISFRPGGA